MYVRIQPDIPKIERTYVYKVTQNTKEAKRIVLGSSVRVVLNGRKQKGWVIDLFTELSPNENIDENKVNEVLEFVSVGPPQHMIEFSEILAERYLISPVTFLRHSSPLRIVKELSYPQLSPGDKYQASCICVDPRANRQEMIEDAISKSGSTLIVSPDGHSKLSRWLSQKSIKNTVLIRGGADLRDNYVNASEANNVVIGSRSALFAPITDLKSIIVLDDSYEQLDEERSPRWRAVDVAKLLADFLSINLTVITSIPSVSSFDLEVIDKRSSVRWPNIKIEDRKSLDPALNGISNIASKLIREAKELGLDSVVVINNKSVSKLLVCKSCESIVACEKCGHSVVQEDDETLVCESCQTRRPIICIECSSASFKKYRKGTKSSVKDFKAMLPNMEVLEITSKNIDEVEKVIVENKRYLFIATEAIFHSRKLCDRLGAVIYQDIDTVVFRPSIAAFEQTLVLINRGLRAVRKSTIESPILISTKKSDHKIFEQISELDFVSNTNKELEIRKVAKLFPYAATAEVKADPDALNELAHKITELEIAVNDDGADSTLLIKAPDHTALTEKSYAQLRNFASKNKFSISVDYYE